MSEFMGRREQKVRQMRELLVKMDRGEITAQQIKENFRDILKDINPAEIALIENELIVREGFPAEKIYKLCDVHIDIFRESLEKENRNFENTKPLNILIEEHNEILKFLGELKLSASELKKKDSFSQNISKFRAQFKVLQGLESHMLREENSLFPFLENHEIVQPPKILWMEHDSLRERIKELRKILENSDEELLKLDFDNKLYPLILYIVEVKSNHIYKENNILFPTAMQKLNAEEWERVLHSMNDIGYADFTPKALIEEAKTAKSEIKSSIKEGIVKFDNGELSLNEIKVILDALPIEFTFVDKDDRVKYFNRGNKRTFVRTSAVIGRSVQNCHPPKSIHIVNKILEDFKNKKRNVAEFWINMSGRLIYIRYFAIRDNEESYLGTLEITQDVTEIKKLEGEKRIYSEELS